MKLKEAIVKAVKFASTDKKSVLSGVLFAPSPIGGFQLWATNDRVGIQLQLDEDVSVPHIVAPAAWLRDVVKHSEIELQLSEHGKLVAVVDGGRLEVMGEPPSKFPVPPAQQQETVTEWHGVPLPEAAIVAGFAAPAKKDKQFASVQFTGEGVYATDTTVIAYAECLFPFKVLLPGETFAAWPSGVGVSVAEDGGWVWFKLGGDEVRMARKLSANLWPGLAARVPMDSAVKQPAIVNRAPFATAVNHAAKASTYRAVQLTFTEKAITVAPYPEAKEGAHKPASTLAVRDTWDHDQATPIEVRGAPLVQALRAGKVPSVMVSHQGRDTPLRVEWGRVVVCIWPAVDAGSMG